MAHFLGVFLARLMGRMTPSARQRLALCLHSGDSDAQPARSRPAARSRRISEMGKRRQPPGAEQERSRAGVAQRSRLMSAQKSYSARQKTGSTSERGSIYNKWRLNKRRLNHPRRSRRSRFLPYRRSRLSRRFPRSLSLCQKGLCRGWS